MKRADPDTLGSESDQLIHTFPHFARCFIGKCNGENIPRVHPFFFNQIGNAVRQHPRLSRSGSRQNQNRSFCLIDRFFLHIIQ